MANELNYWNYFKRLEYSTVWLILFEVICNITEKSPAMEPMISHDVFAGVLFENTYLNSMLTLNRLNCLLLFIVYHPANTIKAFHAFC